MHQIKQFNRRLHFACAVHSVTPFQPIGNAAYRQVPEEDWATDLGNMHKIFEIFKDCACGSGDILVDRQTYPSHYFAIAPAWHWFS